MMIKNMLYDRDEDTMEYGEREGRRGRQFNKLFSFFLFRQNFDYSGYMIKLVIKDEKDN